MAPVSDRWSGGPTAGTSAAADRRGGGGGGQARVHKSQRKNVQYNYGTKCKGRQNVGMMDERGGGGGTGDRTTKKKKNT